MTERTSLKITISFDGAEGEVIPDEVGVKFWESIPSDLLEVLVRTAPMVQRFPLSRGGEA